MTPRLALLRSVAARMAHALSIYAGRPVIGGWPQSRMEILAITAGARRCRACGSTVSVLAGQRVRQSCPTCRTPFFVLGDGGEDASWIIAPELECVPIHGTGGGQVVTFNRVDFCVTLERWSETVDLGMVEGPSLLAAYRLCPGGRRQVAEFYPRPIADRTVGRALKAMREAYEGGT